MNIPESQRLRQIFSEQIDWYKEMKPREDLADEDPKKIDSSQIYDCAWDEFNSQSRGDWIEVLEILAKE